MLCVVAALTGYAAVSGLEGAALPDRDRAQRISSGREDAAAELLDRLAGDLVDGSPSDLRRLAAPGDAASLRQLREMRANVRRLRIADLTLRYLDEQAAQRPAVAPRLARRAWVGQVQVRWRLGGVERDGSEMAVDMTFLQTPRGAAFVSARGDHGDAAPLWLLEELSVRRTGASVVMATSTAGLRGYGRLAGRAVRDVRKVFPRWRGTLVVEVPAGQHELGRVLGVDGRSYRSIAAVTAAVDGSSAGDSPVHIFVNPPVFGPLGERGGQIVMSHEAAHVATGAATSAMAPWLLEGFADYVALADVDLPVQVTASQVIARTRADGVPRRLPGPRDFEADDADLGASYEAAWLACRLLAETYGEQRLIAFYRRADRDGEPGKAFSEVLGTSERAFTVQWRRYLREVSR